MNDVLITSTAGVSIIQHTYRNLWPLRVYAKYMHSIKASCMIINYTKGEIGA